MISTYRKADLTTLAQALQSQRTRSVDLVQPAAKLEFRDGTLRVTGHDPVIGGDGVTEANGVYQLTDVAEDGLASRLDIPRAFLRRLRVSHLDMWDYNVNTLASRSDARFLLRLLRSDDAQADGYDGVLRAVLSSQYRTIDNFDVLLATLQGLQAAGESAPVIEADLTESRMIVRVRSTTVAVHGRSLVDGYRSPYSGKTGAELPLLWAGFVLTNSEVGRGSFSITPRAEFEVCSNGMTITKEALRKVHLGTSLEDGVVQWSEATIAANLALVRAQAGDAVRTFLTPEYWDAKVAAAEQLAGVEVDTPVETIQAISKTLGFTGEQADAILNCFVDGGQRTAGGVMQAVTAAAQRQDDGDVAHDMEAGAWEAMRLAANPRTLARATRR